MEGGVCGEGGSERGEVRGLQSAPNVKIFRKNGYEKGTQQGGSRSVGQLTVDKILPPLTCLSVSNLHERHDCHELSDSWNQSVAYVLFCFNERTHIAMSLRSLCQNLAINIATLRSSSLPVFCVRFEYTFPDMSSWQALF